MTDLKATVLCIYEKSLANNMVHQIKKPFILKMLEGTSDAQHLNKFNTISNHWSRLILMMRLECDSVGVVAK